MSDHEHSHNYEDVATRNLGWVLLLTGGFTVVELFTGLLSGSLALLADAGHMIRDSVGLVIAFVMAQLSRRPSDHRATYGYKRFEVLGAFVNSLLLFGLLAFILIEAVMRFAQPEPIDGLLVLSIGILGLLVNIVGILLLRKGATDNINMRGAYLEVLADALGSGGVIISGVVIMTTGWLYADGVVALAIGLWMIPRTWSLLRDAVRILLEATPRDLDIETLTKKVEQIGGVKRVHDLHVWSLTDSRHLMSVHIECDGLDSDSQVQLLRETQKVAREFGIDHTTAQIEPCPFEDEDLDCD
jgi:cobalt-zinc-cadmium efflux system protein